jgi:hypothetical protein
MAKRAAITLGNLVAQKPGTTPPDSQLVATMPPRENLIGQTLRLNPVAHKQLRQLALDENKKAHDLLIEAVNGLFSARGKPPIA